MQNNEAVEREVDANYVVFSEMVDALIQQHHKGEFVLLRHGQVVNMFMSAGEAVSFAKSNFSDHIFSVQQVLKEPQDLGYFSRVGPYSRL